MSASTKLSPQDLYHLVDAVPVQLWIATPDGALCYVNKRVTDYFRRSEEEMIGEGCKDVVHPADLDATMKLWQRALRIPTQIA